MISKECFTATWIDRKSKELQYNDKNIIEKVIRAFSLLDMLAQSGCPFHFKGGSCLMLLLKNGCHRLSIDIDIICHDPHSVSTLTSSVLQALTLNSI